MDQLVSKLHDLAYEFFGILVPGVVGLFCVGLWAAGLGPLLPLFTGGVVPLVTVQDLAAFVIKLDATRGVCVGVAAYFVGHTLHWFSRRGDKLESGDFRPNMWAALRLKPAKGVGYDDRLQPLLNLLLTDFAAPLVAAQRAAAQPQGRAAQPAPPAPPPLTWPTFFPLARVYVQLRLSSSLIAIYQHKYTLHRSIATVAAIHVWMCLTGIAVMLVYWRGWVWDTWHFGINLVGLCAMTAIAALLVWTFSQSYKYYWTLFGSTVISETYTLYTALDHAARRSESAGSGPGN